ncbi:MAG: DUF2934 domain-containing protein [Xanthobacteraceae bacterium]|nr:DUF2934 domain-containing protein [Xanthobacteraceae bacterium]
MDDLEERIRKRAYQLWEEEGCPEGRADAHWDKAAELVAIEDSQQQTTRPVSRTVPQTRSGEPLEPVEAVRNAGEFPTLTDQGEQEVPARKSAPKRTPRAAPRKSGAAPPPRK